MHTGDDASALAIFNQIASETDLPQPYRVLALIRQTTLDFDTLAPAAVIERLDALAKPGSPWFGSAGEMVALAHLKQNKPEAAAPIFAAMVKDETVPESIRSRAVQMARSEEHTSELQSLMRISYAVFCLKKKKIQSKHNNAHT